MANLSATPLALDPYARFQLQLFDERAKIGVSTLFQSIFGRPVTGGQTLFSPDSIVADIDIIRANERTAKMQLRGTKGRNIGTAQANTEQERYTNINRIFPLVKEEGDIESDMLVLRKAGESPISGQTQMDRLRAHASEIHMEQVRRIVRLDEVLASQSARTGIQDAILGTADTNLQYDFLRDATHTFTPTPIWTNSSSNPVADLDLSGDLIRENGKANADVVIMGTDAINAFVNHAGIQLLADNRRFQLIDVNSNPVPANLQFLIDGGAIARGRVQTPGGRMLWIFTYLDGYTNDAGNFTKYMPDDEVLVFASSARCDRQFGPPEYLPMIPMRIQLYQEIFGFAPGLAPMPINVKNRGAVILPEAFYFDAYTNQDWTAVTLRSQTAPIFATTQTDAFVRMDGVA